MRPWQLRSRRSLLKVSPWLEVWRDVLELPDGRKIDDYHTIELPPYAVIVALTPDGLVVGERHYRPGARAVTLSLPSGFLHDGEDPEAGARRELREETGYEAAAWSGLGAFVVDGNRGCGTAHFYLAKDARKVSDPDGRDLAEMHVELVSLPQFVRSVQTGASAELATAAGIGLASIALNPAMTANRPLPSSAEANS